MKTRDITLFYAIIAFIIANIAMADNVITKTHNFPVDGDRFNKTRVSYITPGDTGRNVVWDFTQAQVIDGNSRVAYSVVDDSLFNVTELNTRYDYRLSGDTLYGVDMRIAAYSCVTLWLQWR